MNIQWYPGHMTKTRRMIEENLKMVDLAVEILDARLPASSQNPVLSEILGQKPKIILLNKSDLADEVANQCWAKAFHEKGTPVLFTDCASGKGLGGLEETAKKLLSERIENDRKKGIVGRAIRMMVVGIPNSGKSSFINRVSGRAGTKTGDRPGVTRDKQWIRMKNGMELLDTPGILWPKFEDPEVGKRLAFTGAIKDEIMDVEELACLLIDTLSALYPNELKARYKLDSLCDTGYETLEMIAKKRGFVMSGGALDTLRASNILLDEFRSGKIGRMTLELPE